MVHKFVFHEARFSSRDTSSCNDTTGKVRKRPKLAEGSGKSIVAEMNIFSGVLASLETARRK